MDRPHAARVKTFEVRRLKAGVSSPANEDLIIEKTVSLTVNGVKLLSFQCVPEQVEELAVGFLITEGLASSPKDILNVAFDPQAQAVAARLHVSEKELKEFREALVSGSSCGKALTMGAPLDPLDCRRRIDLTFHVGSDILLAVMGEFRRRAAHPGRPRGVHAAALAQGARIVAFAEDVGRHNAADKVVGSCSLQRTPLHDKMLLTTGRISLEVAAKALRAGVAVVASTRSPTAAAVDLARESAITLAGLMTANSMTLYSAEWRITSKP